jgi:hypothetical protein
MYGLIFGSIEKNGCGWGQPRSDALDAFALIPKTRSVFIYTGDE